MRTTMIDTQTLSLISRKNWKQLWQLIQRMEVQGSAEKVVVNRLVDLNQVQIRHQTLSKWKMKKKRKNQKMMKKHILSQTLTIKTTSRNGLTWMELYRKISSLRKKWWVLLLTLSTSSSAVSWSLAQSRFKLQKDCTIKTEYIWVAQVSWAQNCLLVLLSATNCVDS